MKFLKIPLADGKVYTFTTFTVLEISGLRKERKNYQDMEEEVDKINNETDEKGNIKKDSEGRWIPRTNLTSEHKKRLEQIENHIFDFGVDIFRKSLSRKHPEFKKQEDPKKEQEVRDACMDLIDADDLRNIIQFAFGGNYVKQNNVIEISLPSFEDLDEEEDKK